MYHHAPEDYGCPFCRFKEGDNAIRPSEIVYQDKHIIAFISRDWWPNNPGHVLITPREHFENIYELPDYLSDRIHRLEKRVAIALKNVYLCDGVSSRQHNEPSGSQDVWHYHLHVFPRHKNDDLYLHQRVRANHEDRVQYAQKLQAYFEKNPPVLE